MNWRFRVTLDQRGGKHDSANKRRGNQYLQNTEINGMECANEFTLVFFFFCSGSMQSIRIPLARIHLL